MCEKQLRSAVDLDTSINQSVAQSLTMPRRADYVELIVLHTLHPNSELGTVSELCLFLALLIELCFLNERPLTLSRTQEFIEIKSSSCWLLVAVNSFVHSQNLKIKQFLRRIDFVSISVPRLLPR